MSDKSFVYRYSAKEQEEIKKIREKYTPKEDSETDKLAQLKALDESVTQKGTVVSLIVGIVGILVMGFGMSLAMSDLGEKLHMPHPMVIGIIIGVAGIIGVALAYPLYEYITKKERERVAPEIIRLSDELMK